MLNRLRFLFEKPIPAKSAVDLQIYLFFAPMALITSVLSGGDFDRPAHTAALVVANVISISLLYLLLRIIRAYLRSREPNRTYRLIGFAILGIGLGFFKGAVTGLAFFAVYPGQSLYFEVVSRIWATPLMGMVLVTLITLAGTLRAQYSEERRALIAEKVAFEAGSAPSNDAPDEYLSQLRERVAQLRSASPETFAPELRKIIAEDLRPTSHKIWLREASRFPTYSFRQVLKVALAGPVYKPLGTASIFLLGSLLPAILYFGAVSGILVALLRTAVIVVGLIIASRFKPSDNFWAGLWRYMAVMAVIAIGSELLVFSLLPMPWSLDRLGPLISGFAWISQGGLSFGMVSAFLTMGDKVQREISELADANQIELDQWRNGRNLRNRELAQFLHGHLQNQLFASAIRIEASLDSESRNKELIILDQVLQASISEFYNGRQLTLDAVCTEIKASWDGIIRCETSAASHNIGVDDLGVDLLQKLSDVVNEGVSNAVRHGFASEAKIKLELVEGLLKVEIVDDGLGPRSGVAGLGSHLFDSIAEQWSLEPGATGSVLSVSLKA